MKFISDFCFIKRKEGPLLSTLYALLWFFGLCSAIASYIELQQHKLLGARLGDAIAVIFAAATIAQQLAVYGDVHFIEDHPDIAAYDYPEWLNMPLERFLRWGILISLLFGVGKIADGLYPLAERIHCYVIRTAVTEFLRPHDAASKFSRNLFVKGSFAVFLLLTIWNLFALGFRVKHMPKSSTTKERAHDVVVTLRITMFIFLSLVCSLYWAFVFMDSPRVSDAAEILVLFYLLAVGTVLALRWGPSRERIESKFVARAIEWLRS